MRARSKFAVAALFLAVFASPAPSAEFWWTGDLSNGWNSTSSNFGTILNTNWATLYSGGSDRLALPGTSDVVRFAASGAIHLNTAIDSGGASVYGLTTEFFGTTAVSIQNGPLTVGAFGIVMDTPSTLTISSPLLTTAASYSITTANASASLLASGSLNSPASLTKAGPGLLTLANVNSYTGGTKIVQGTIVTATANALPLNRPLTLGDSVSGSTARLNTGGFSQTLSAMTVYAPSVANTTVVDVGTGTLTLAGNLTLLNTTSNAGNLWGATITGSTGSRIDLGGNIRNITLAGQRISQNELVVQPIITNGGINLTANPSTLDGTPAGMILAASAPNTYTGSTRVNAGVLTVNSSTTLGPGPLTLSTTGSIDSRVRFNNPAQTINWLNTTTLGTAIPVIELNGTALTVDQSVNTTFAGTLNGTGSLTKSGGGTLTVTSANTYSGGTTITAGALQIGDGGTSGAISGNITNNASLILNRSDSFTLPGLISGTGTLTKSGGGTFTLASSNTYSGGTIVTGGTLVAASNYALPDGRPLTVGQATAAATALVNTGGFAQSISSLALFARSGSARTALDIGDGLLILNGDVTLLDTQDAPGNAFGVIIEAAPDGRLNLNGGIRNFTLAGQNVNQSELTVNAVITNDGINLTANPSSTMFNSAGMVLNASSPNTYVGGTTVNAGVLTVNPATTLGPGALMLKTTGSVESRVRLNNPFQTLTSLQTGSLGTATPVIELNGTALTVNQSIDTTFAGVISGTGSLKKSGGGTLTLANSNTYSGGTTVTGGTLTAGTVNALPLGSPLRIEQPSPGFTARVNTGGFAQTISSLTLFACTFPDEVPVDVGSGTLTLTGDVLLVYGPTLPGNGFGATIAAAPGGTLNLGGSIRNITVPTWSQWTQHFKLTVNAVIANGGINLTANSDQFSGMAGMVLAASAPNTYTGGTTVNTGFLTVNPSTTLGPGALVLNTIGTARSEVRFLNPDQTLTSLQTGSLGSGGASVDLDGTALTVNQSIDTTFAGYIRGTGSLTKSGVGTLTLASMNIYSGGTVVTGGTLIAAAADALPAGRPLTIGQASMGNTARVNTGGFAQYISSLTLYACLGSNRVAVDIGSGTLTLNGHIALLDTQDLPGDNFGATLAASAGGTLNLGGAVRNITLAGQRVLMDELIITPVITNGGINLTANPSSIYLTPAGMILNAASPNTYAGGTTVNAGFLTVNASTTLGPGALTINTTGGVESGVKFLNSAQTIASLQTGSLGTGAASISLNGTTLTVNQSINTTFAGSIVGIGNLIHAGSGILTLSGPLAYTDQNSVTSVTGGGKLVLQSALSTTPGDVLVGTNGKIDFALPRTASPVMVSRIDNLSVANGGIAKITHSARTGGSKQGVLIVNTLSITGTGFLDLTNNDLIVRSQSVAAVRSLVGAWYTAANGLPGTRGLGSSESFYTVDGAFATLAVYDNSIAGQTLTSFSGQPVLPSDILVKYTYLGDTNIDGVVDASDLARLLQGMRGQGSGWNFGDVNYDGIVNFTDLGRTMATLRGQGAPLNGNLSGGGGPIPEPTSLGILVAAVPLMVRRRR